MLCSDHLDVVNEELKKGKIPVGTFTTFQRLAMIAYQRSADQHQQAMLAYQKQADEAREWVEKFEKTT